MKERLHVTLDRRIKRFVKDYVALKHLQGEIISEGKVIEDALKFYNIEQKCKAEKRKARTFWTSKD